MGDFHFQHTLSLIKIKFEGGSHFCLAMSGCVHPPFQMMRLSERFIRFIRQYIADYHGMVDLHCLLHLH
jgi:hypothetical protein